ncbi:uncharacterized protein LOC141700904 [Apium graveolens]|uniref:uncharacterized protein LOC141700904 n=1 Tax=Apium graveolens TaxID=4045 RepID=UPI003D7A2C6E
MVITWILNTVSDDINNNMNYMDSAYAVWHELNERFFAVFWDEIKALEPTIKCSCGAVKDWENQLEKTRLIQFLMGLHSSYTATRGQLLMMSPWPTVNQAFMLLKQEEKAKTSPTLF